MWCIQMGDLSSDSNWWNKQMVVVFIDVIIRFIACGTMIEWNLHNYIYNVLDSKKYVEGINLKPRIHVNKAN